MSVADDVAMLRAAATKGGEVLEQVSGTDLIFDEILDMVQQASGITSNAMEAGAMIDGLHDAMDQVQQRTLLLTTHISAMADRAEGTLP